MPEKIKFPHYFSPRTIGNEIRRNQDIQESQFTFKKIGLPTHGRPWPHPLKGALVNYDDTEDRLEFHYNPPELPQRHEVVYAEHSVPGLRGPLLQYVRGGAHTISLELLFNDYHPHAENKKTADEAIQWLENAKNPAGLERTPSLAKAPPKLVFVWGASPVPGDIRNIALWILKDSIEVTRTLFDPFLGTLRATVRITLQEYIEAPI